MALFSGRVGPDGQRGLFLIAGPCVLETDRIAGAVAERVAELADRHGVTAIFKSSFDKANRSAIDSPRGPGLARGLEMLAAARERSGLPVLTDLHLPEQAEPVAAVVDAVQIPAFLCRQTDLLVAAATTGRPVNVKKGQWMAPGDIAGAVEKLRRSGAAEVAVTERGTAFGYGRWIVDMRSFWIMRAATGCAAVFDATHAVQLPGGADGASGGEPEHIERLAAAAVAAGADGLFVEVHPRPEEADSDGTSMLPLDRLDALLARCVAVRAAVAEGSGEPR